MGFDSERVSEGIHHFRRSCYDVWDEGEEPEPEEARRGSRCEHGVILLFRINF